MGTYEVWAYVGKGIAGAPGDKYGIHVTGVPDRETPSWAYWALSAAPYDKFPGVLMHVYFEGELPNEATRDAINRTVKGLTGKLLFEEK